MQIFDFLALPLGKLMQFIYQTVAFQNYGWAIVIFTVLTKAAMLPLSIKQFKSMARMQKLNPRLEELRRQYGTDRQRLNEETMKLYQEEKINPAGGCLPMLITFPLMLSLYQVILQPLRFLLDKTPDQIASLMELFRQFSASTAANIQQMEILNFFGQNADAMAAAQSQGLMDSAELLNLRFLGLDLAMVPTYSPEKLFGPQAGVFIPLLLVALGGVAFSFLSSKLTTMASMASSQSNRQATSMSKMMLLMGPAFTLIFSFQFPLGVLLYWDVGYVIQAVQQLFVNKYVYKIGAFGSKRAPQPDLVAEAAERKRNEAQAALPADVLEAGGQGGGQGQGVGGQHGGAGSGRKGGGAGGGRSGASSGAGGGRSGGGQGGGAAAGRSGVGGHGAPSGSGSHGSHGGNGGAARDRAAAQRAGSAVDTPPKVTSITSDPRQHVGQSRSHVAGGTFDRDISRYIAGAASGAAYRDDGAPGFGGAGTDGVSGSDAGAGVGAGPGSAYGAGDEREEDFGGAYANSDYKEDDAARAEAMLARIKASGGRSSATRNFGSSKRGGKRKK